jgi:hypothetical protein
MEQNRNRSSHSESEFNTYVYNSLVHGGTQRKLVDMLISPKYLGKS